MNPLIQIKQTTPLHSCLPALRFCHKRKQHYPQRYPGTRMGAIPRSPRRKGAMLLLSSPAVLETQQLVGIRSF